MVLAGNEAKRLSSVNHTTKTIHHHHHRPACPFLQKGGFVSLRHNHIRNITSILLKEFCKDVHVELQLQQITGEYLQHSAAAGNEVRLDISACGFWQAGQMAFLDVRVFNPNAKRYANIKLSKAYEINEKEKKKTYNERILQVEHGSFTPNFIHASQK